MNSNLFLIAAYKAISENATVSAESTPWCRKYDHAIDYELVRVTKPHCVESSKGCAGCEHQYQKESITVRQPHD